jgi:type III restriction enzyme
VSYEVPEPIITSPYEEPHEHWRIVEGEPARREQARRKAMYFYRDPKFEHGKTAPGGSTITIELMRVNIIRQRVGAWRAAGYPGVTRTTHELLQWWQREGRERRLFFAQREAAETIIFLREARADFLQGIDVPRDEPSDEQKAKGISGFLRQACKMATGTGKTTVMGMITAWSILNKVNSRSDARFSDVVLAVCPNVTIRDRLRELDPEMGEASIYRKSDLVPPHLLPLLNQGKVIVTNWHGFELRSPDAGGVSAKVMKAGVREETRERIHIGAQNTTARGKRYLNPATFEALIAAGKLEVIEGSEKRDEADTLISVEVRAVRYVESDASLVQRVLGREVGGKQNILVLNDEAHHAYRIRRDEADEDEDDLFGEDEEAEEFYKEATVWVEGLDRIHRLRGINLCVDLSATPYFLGRVGQAANRPFPWVVSDFGLIDAIEAGLVKIPQLAVRDTTGAAIPGYFNIWNWILPQLSPAERGGKKASPKPEAILKYAHTPIAMLGGLWEKKRTEWAQNEAEQRQPVFIFICKNTQIAKVLYEWIAEDKCPAGIPPSKIDGFRNRDGALNTIRVDSKVVHETDAGGAKADESRWMRFTLDTVGKQHWPADRQSRPVLPDGFAELAEKLERPLHPPGRDVRCIVSVGMLTEGWDCNTVTHIVGLRPFMSQLLCEQVVGRGLRRANYEPDETKTPPLLREEVAQVFGVPFEVVPFKANAGGPTPMLSNRSSLLVS